MKDLILLCSLAPHFIFFQIWSLLSGNKPLPIFSPQLCPHLLKVILIILCKIFNCILGKEFAPKFLQTLRMPIQGYFRETGQNIFYSVQG